jgi:hypothetical protein
MYEVVTFLFTNGKEQIEVNSSWPGLFMFNGTELTTAQMAYLGWRPVKDENGKIVVTRKIG